LSERIIVTGSRGWHDRQKIANRLFDLPVTCTIVVGYNPEKDTPKGVDRIAYQEAQKLGLLVEPHPADWERYGKPAGFIRNEEMAAAGAILCLAFWDGRSNGTKDMMDRSERHSIPVEVVWP
jgi:hypothetical protein